MLKMECKICRAKGKINSKLLSLRSIKFQCNKLFKEIPNNFNNFKKKNIVVRRIESMNSNIRGLCGTNCFDNSYHLLKREEREVFEIIAKILCYYEENKDLNLISLKRSCAGEYSFVYNVIDRIEHVGGIQL